VSEGRRRGSATGNGLRMGIIECARRAVRGTESRLVEADPERTEVSRTTESTVPAALHILGGASLFLPYGDRRATASSAIGPSCKARHAIASGGQVETEGSIRDVRCTFPARGIGEADTALRHWTPGVGTRVHHVSRHDCRSAEWISRGRTTRQHGCTERPPNSDHNRQTGKL
jgi:hypothetical protein